MPKVGNKRYPYTKAGYAAAKKAKKAKKPKRNGKKACPDCITITKIQPSFPLYDIRACRSRKKRPRPTDVKRSKGRTLLKLR